MKSYKAFYEAAILDLEAAGVPNCSYDAMELLLFCSGMSKTQYYMRCLDIMPEKESERFLKCIERRGKREPLQHIIGVTGFYGRNFKVNKNVLIPRQDTEHLVEYALKYISDESVVLDMCTGSGCIAITVALERNGCKVFAADISDKALLVARENAENLGVDVNFVESDLFQKFSENAQFDVIVSNPPYIATSVIEGLEREVKDFDPMLALDGKEDGLFFYRKIINDSVKYLKNKGHILFEIGYDQGASVSELLKETGFEDIRCHKDYAGFDRVVEAMWP